MKRFVGFCFAMFLALVAIALVGGDSGAVAGHGCHGRARSCHGGHKNRCHGKRHGRKHRCHGEAAPACEAGCGEAAADCGCGGGCGGCGEAVSGGCAGGGCGGSGVISEGVPTEAPAAPAKT